MKSKSPPPRPLPQTSPGKTDPLCQSVKETYWWGYRVIPPIFFFFFFWVAFTYVRPLSALPKCAALLPRRSVRWPFSLVVARTVLIITRGIVRPFSHIVLFSWCCTRFTTLAHLNHGLDRVDGDSLHVAHSVSTYKGN